MNISIVNAYGFSNRGDAVLLEECIHEIKAKHSTVNINVGLFDSTDFVETDSLKAMERLGHTAGKGLYNKIKRALDLIVLTLYCLFGLKALLSLLRPTQRNTAIKLINSDLIVSCPGGYIHDTNKAYFIALLNIYYSIQSGKKVILAPQSIGPINSVFGRKLLKYVLNGCHNICVRESFSRNFLIECGIDTDKIIPCGDSAFWNENVAVKGVFECLSQLSIKPETEFIGITVVDWTFPNQQTPHDLKDKYIKAIRGFSKYFFDKYGLKTVIFNQVEDDLNITDDIRMGIDNIFIIDRLVKSPATLRAMIARSKIFVGTRFHSCIFSIMANVPTHAIAYLPKTEYILKDLGLGERYIDINNIDLSLLISKVEKDLLDIDKAKSDIKSKLDIYKSKFKRLRDVL